MLPRPPFYQTIRHIVEAIWFVFEAPKLAKGKMLEKGGHHHIACV